MDDTFLVASHLSSLPSSTPASIIVTTTRKNASSPSHIHSNDLPNEHALSTSTLHNDATGTILLRVIHGGLILELISISANIPALRFVLPTTSLSSPCMFLWEENTLHILVVTDIGSIYRFIVPVDGLKLWQDYNTLEYISVRESYVPNAALDYLNGTTVHAQGIDSLAMTAPNGGLLRLDSDFFAGNGQQEETWSETLFYHGSFLGTLTSLLHSSTPGASDIISLASHPWPTDIGNVWTLSRDRTLRLWKAKQGCVASRTLPFAATRQDHSSAVSGESKFNLLDAENQNLLKVFSEIWDEEETLSVYVLVFLPTSTANSGGFFVLFDSSSDQLIEVAVIQCPKNTRRCHLQDFTVDANTLYTLWDRQGQSIVQRTEMDLESLKSSQPSLPIWKTSEYAEEPDLSPAYMEEQLLAPGSLPAKFLEAIMKPGSFSSLTLRTALDKYMEACLSLPGDPPPQLSTSYGSLCESIAAIVGCTVTLNRDPQTGGFQHASYWTALKRDWEGFVARCREVERNARWPLVIGRTGKGGIVFAERERVGSLYPEDVPVSFWRMLEKDIALHPDHDLFGVMWGLRSKLEPHTLANIEMRIVDIMQQEIAFTFSEILQDQAQRIQFEDNLEEGAKDWFDGRLKSIQDVDKAIRTALDSIGALELAVKPEESEVDVLNPVSPSAWERQQAARYSSATIRARYDLCLSLIILLLFVADELPSWDASLIAEIFAVFRGIATLRYVANQSVENDSLTNRAAQTTADDVVAQLRNMKVSNPSNRIPAKSSLLHLLLSQAPAAETVPTTAHNFLDSTGVLQSLSTAHVTKHEATFCNRLLSLGLLDVVRELLSWLPRTPSTIFLQSQVFLRLRRPDDAAELLGKLAGCFGVSNLSLEDSDALAAVLPNASPIDSEYSFYLFAAGLFHPTYTYYEVQFSKLALQVAPPEVETSPLWTSIVQGLIDLRQYQDAYATVMTTPFVAMKTEFAKQLAARMCEDNAVKLLTAFDFAGVSDAVGDHLAFKARTRNPLDKPCYSRILYTWYTKRADYRNAALVMYQRASNFGRMIVDVASFAELAEQQLEALSISINALHLVDEKMAWFIVRESSPRHRKASKYIPDDKFLSGEDQLVTLKDLQREFTLLQVHIEMVRKRKIDATEFSLAPSVIIMRLAQAGQYTQALSIASSLQLDMADIFTHLTNQCVRLTRNPGSVLQEDTSDWLLTDSASSWTGTSSDRGWKFLQQSLKRYDNVDTDNRYAKAALETILAVEQSVSPPPWLINVLQKAQPEYLIRASLRYDNLEDAVNYAYALVLESDKQITRDPSRNASTTWLPYALIDQVLVAADTQMKTPPHLSNLKTALNNRINRVQKLSQASA